MGFIILDLYANNIENKTSIVNKTDCNTIPSYWELYKYETPPTTKPCEIEYRGTMNGAQDFLKINVKNKNKPIIPAKAIKVKFACEKL